MIFEVQQNQGGEVDNGFDFHNAIALSGDYTTIFACIEISDNAVAVYKRVNGKWEYDRTLADNKVPLFTLYLSGDERFLIAAHAFGFKLWNIPRDKLLDLKVN